MRLIQDIQENKKTAIIYNTNTLQEQKILKVLNKHTAKITKTWLKFTLIYLVKEFAVKCYIDYSKINCTSFNLCLKIIL